MRNLTLGALFVVSLISPGLTGAASDLAVTVKNIGMKNGQADGVVYVCLYPASSGGSPDFPTCELAGVKKTAMAGIQNGTGSVTFTGLTNGQYALSAFQDTNGNEKLDMGMVFPNERAGTYKPLCHKPTFDEIAFAVPSAIKPTIQLIDFGFFGILSCHT